MSTTWTVTVTIKEDGVTVPGFPVTKTLATTESAGKQIMARADGAGYVDLPLSELGNVDLLYVESDQALTLRFNDQSDAGIPLDASGLLLAVGISIPSGATSKASADNSSGSAAEVVQVAGGS